jgi:hypothetical protein
MKRKYKFKLGDIVEIKADTRVSSVYHGAIARIVKIEPTGHYVRGPEYGAMNTIEYINNTNKDRRCYRWSDIFLDKVPVEESARLLALI